MSSNSIENKTVQMEFDNAQFERETKTSLKTMDSLKKGLNFSGVAKGLGDVSAAAGRLSLGNIASGVDSLKNRFSLMGIVAITAIQNITNRLFAMGEQLVRTFTIDPISTGLQEYETQINAIQTILANTASKGTTMQEVIDALGILNTYADKTIYNFTEMTRNIGTFTAAGVDLDTSVAAIKGIANLAAVSGSNAQQAATAMYQLSQALSSGTVKLMDWNSVVNAGMGGQVFQDALKETARLHGIAIDKMIEDEGSFRETLSEGWLSSEILTETLAKFTGDLTDEQLRLKGYTDEQIKSIQELGKTANDAATKVKTITQLNDTLKEAAQSGWTQTWQLIIGDFEEAKSFLTGISDYLGGLIAESANARNALVEGWKNLGGRDELLASIYSVLYLLKDLTTPLKEAFREIFPPVTAQQLYDITHQVQLFIENIRLLIKDHMPELKRVFKGFFSLLDIGRMFIVAVAKAIFGLSDSLKPVGSFLGNIVLNFADYITNVRDTIKKTDAFTNSIKNGLDYIKPYTDKLKDFVTWFKNLFSTIKGVDTSGIGTFLDNLTERLNFAPLTKLRDILGKFFVFLGVVIAKAAPILSKLGSIIGDGLLFLLDKLTDWIDKFDPGQVLDVLNKGLFAALLFSIKKFIDDGTEVFGGITDILDGVKGSLEAWQDSLKATTLLKIAGAIGILAVSLFIIGTIDSDKLLGALGAITAMFVELFGAMKVFSQTSAGVKSLATMTLGLIGISTAMLIMAGALAIIASIDPDAYVRAFLGISILVALLQKTAKELGTAGPGVISAAIGVSIFAVGLNIMALAVKQLGSIQTGVLTQGLIGIAAVLAEIAIFLKVAGGSKSMILAATGVVILSTALLIFSGAIAILGNIPMNKLMQGLLGIAIGLGIISAAMNTMPPDMLVTATALGIVAVALVGLALALKIMAGFSWEEVAKSLVTLAASLTILTVAMSAMTGLIGGAASLLIAAAALGILAVSLKLLGSMSLEEIGLALLAIAGTLTVLGVAAAILTPLIPSLLGLAVALALIGVAALATGVGVLALSIGLTALAAAGGAIATSLVLIITSIISLLPIIAKQVGVALISLIKTIADGAPLLLEGIVTILSTIIQGLVQVTPELIDAIFSFVTTLLVKLAAATPDIVQAGYDILIALLQGANDNIEDILVLVNSIIAKFLRGIGEGIPEIVDAGYDLIINFIDGMADSAEKNIPRLMTAVQHLGASIVRGVINGIFSARGELVASVEEIGNTILSEFARILGIQSPSSEFIDRSYYIVMGLVEGLKKYGNLAFSAASDLANGTTNAFGQVLSRISDTIDSTVDMSPTISPVLDLDNIVSGAGRIEDIMSNANMNLVPALNNAQSISTGMRPSTEQQINAISGKDQTAGGTLNFTQINNSPKALSRAEVYRQTKLQLLQARGMVGSK